MNLTKNIAKIFINALNNEEYVIDKTGCKTIEIIGASFIAGLSAMKDAPIISIVFCPVLSVVNSSLAKASMK